MPISTLRSFTRPYSAAEAWLYDLFLAPAVEAQGHWIGERLLGDVPERGDLLDVGCGGGQNLLAVARRRPDLHIVGLDLSAGQISRARRRARGLAPRVELVEGSALELPFADGSFDYVMSIASIKHWPDPRRGLSECVRVLRPGGRLTVVEADRGCRQDDAMTFVRGFRMPSFAAPASLIFFRVLVAGRSLDLDDARALLDGLPLRDASVTRVPESPALAIRGVKTE